MRTLAVVIRFVGARIIDSSRLLFHPSLIIFSCARESAKIKHTQGKSKIEARVG